MKSVLLIATTTGYQIRSFGEAAERLGVRLVIASDRCDQFEDPWWDQAIPVRFHDVPGSIDAIRERCASSPPQGVVAVGDRPAVLAAHAARAFGLAGHPPDATERSRNKLATRQAQKAAGLPVPWFEAIAIDDDVRAVAGRVPYPAVVKPLALSGSRGVMRVDDAGELAAAVDRLRALLRLPDVRAERDAAHGQAVVESFIPGTEYAVEGLLEDGRLRVLATFDKPDPLDGPFFEETIYVTPSRASEAAQRRIADAVAATAAALGLRHGPVHAECRVDLARAPDAVYVLEVAARPIGGLCSRALRFEDHAPKTDDRGPTTADPKPVESLEEVLLRHALGEDVTSHARERPAAGVMMIPIPRRGVFRRVDGLEQARAVSAIEDIRITAKPDAPVVPLPEGRSYLGFMFARAGEPGAVEQALRTAHARLSFVIDREVYLAC